MMMQFHAIFTDALSYNSADGGLLLKLEERPK